MFLPQNSFIIRRNTASPVPSAADRRGGFALLITITLMAFLVLLMVSMSRLLQVETSIAVNSQQAESARQNALVALNIALGQLQAAAGPDQRVTARAEILDSSPSSASVDSVKQPYWTGVWATGSAPLDLTDTGVTVQRTTSLGSTSPTPNDKVTNAKAWLVSRPTGSTVDPTSAALTVADDLSEATLSASAAISGVTGGASEPTAALLAKKYGRKDPSALPDDSTNPGFIVAAPLVDLTATPPGFTVSKTIGRYAYWVGDEGVKAKVNLTDATLGLPAAGDSADPTATTAQTHFLAPQAAPAHKIDGLVKDPAVDYRLENEADLAKVIAPNSLAFLSTTPVGLNLKPYQPDVTVYSQGVLANVKHGGLKKDLTAAFETPSEYTKLTSDNTGGVTDYGYEKNMLYRNYSGQTYPYFTPTTASSLYAGFTDGLSWAALYAYYNTYKSTMVAPAPGGVSPTTTAGALAPTAAGSLASTTGYTLRPRLLGINTVVSGTTRTAIHTGLYPQLLAYSMDIALQARYNESLDNKWRFYLLRYPRLVLYNPYNCRLSFTGFQFTQFIFGAFRNASNVPYCITVTVRDPTTGTTTTAATKIPLSPRASGTVQLITKSGECDTLEPGETRVFGLAGADIRTSTYRDWGLADQLTSQLVAVNTSGDWADYTELPATVTLSGSEYVLASSYGGTANATDDVTVSITDLSGTLVTTLPMKITTNTTVPVKAGTRILTGATDLVWPQNTSANIAYQENKGVRNTTGVTLPTWTSVTVTGLQAPRILAGIRLRRKGLVADTSTAYTNNTMTVPHFHGNAPGFSIFSNLATAGWLEFYTNNNFGANYSSSGDVNLVSSINGGNLFEASWGDNSLGLNSIAPRRVLADVPGQPLVSLGQFMHMTTINVVSGSASFGARASGSMAVGGSLCSPFIATDNNRLTYASTASPTQYIFDDSFLANDNLFDRFYLSTVPPATPALPVPQQWTAFNDANRGSSWAGDTSVRLPNARMQPYARNGVAPTMANLRDFDQSAANLLLNGAFNVNSTSVDAWKVLLSSLSGNDLRVFNPVTNSAQTITSSNLKNPIPRFWGSATSTGGAWDGARALSDAEVTTLAKSIVEQVKTRGPFLSMSDFLNRRLGTNSELTRAGCLQAAIDNTTLNDSVKASGTTVTASGGGLSNSDLSGLTVVAANLLDGAGNALNTTVGMPGYLMQQDIVQAFSSAMTVRSDTFVIRTYGETVNPATGLTQSKAWAEAVVQRLPEFVDQTDTKLTSGDATPLYTSAGTSNLNDINTNFGRRFKVVGFRWLSPADL